MDLLLAAWSLKASVTSMTLPSTNLLCDALHRASPDPEGPSHLQDTHTLRKLLSHLAFGRAVYLRPAELHALSDSALEAGFDSLANHCALKLSERAGDLENELAHRRRRVDGLLVQIQIHAAGFEVLDRVEQVNEGTAQAVNRPCHDDIELPPAGVLEHGIESRPSVSSLGARDACIAVDLHDVPTAPPGHLPKLADLILHRLCVGAHPHVQRCALRA